MKAITCGVISGGAGALAFFSMEHFGLSTGSRVFDGAVGLGSIFAGYYLDKSIASEILVGAGVGALLRAIL